jgi:hypothetical protein
MAFAPLERTRVPVLNSAFSNPVENVPLFFSAMRSTYCLRAEHGDTVRRP